MARTNVRYLQKAVAAVTYGLIVFATVLAFARGPVSVLAMPYGNNENSRLLTVAIGAVISVAAALFFKGRSLMGSLLVIAVGFLYGAFLRTDSSWATAWVIFAIAMPATISSWAVQFLDHLLRMLLRKKIPLRSN